VLYKEDWENAQRRLVAWWDCQVIDRPAIQVTAPRARPLPAAEPPSATLEEARTVPEVVVAHNEHRFARTSFGGEAFPYIFVNLGPGIASTYLGGNAVIDENTVWYPASHDTVDEIADLPFDREGRWWQITTAVTEGCAQAGSGKWLTSITDIGGIADLIANLIGTEKLLFAMHENPEGVKRARDRLLRLWFEVYDACHELLKPHQDGTTPWLGVWSPGKTYSSQCDFAAFLSPEMFREFFLPDLAAQFAFLDHGIYHWDGPDAVVHLDALLELEDLHAIQWVPGAGAPEPIEWVPLLRKVQDAGKGLVLHLQAKDVPRALREFRPEGLLMKTSCTSEEEARDLLRYVEAHGSGR